MALQREITTVVSERFRIGESPVWNADTQELLWCDIPVGRIHALHTPTGARRHWDMGEAVGSFGLCRSGRLVVGLVNQVVIFEPDSGRRYPVAHIEHAKPGMRLNDGKVGPDGAFWVGSMDPEPGSSPQGKLYRVASNGAVSVAAQGIAISNGLAWTCDATRLFHSDSRGGLWIDGWDFDRTTGAVRNRQRFANAGEDVGRADGGACDLEGCYWSGGPSQSRLNRYSPSGDLLDWVDLPVLRPTMPCFGGPDMRTIYVASLSAGVNEDLLDRYPLCGAIVSFRSQTAGVPICRFAD